MAEAEAGSFRSMFERGKAWRHAARTRGQTPSRALRWLLLILAGLACGVPAAWAAAAPPRDVFASGIVESLESTIASLMQHLQPVLAAAPGLRADLAQFFGRLADPAQGPAGPWIWRSAVALAAALIAIFWVPGWVDRLCHRFSGPDRQPGAQMAGKLISDLCGILALIAAFSVAKALWFADGSTRAAFTVALLGGFVHWRLMMLPVDILLRRRRPGARLVETGDAHAAEMHRLAAWLLGFVAFSKAILRAFLGVSMPLLAVQFLALVVGVVDAGLAFYLVGRLHRTLRAGSAGPPASRLARLWYPLALLYVLAAAMAWLLGAVLMDFAVYWALLAMGAVVLGSLILHSIVKVVLARSAGTGVDAAMGATARWHRVIRHCVAVLLWVAATVLIVEIWIEPLAPVLPMAEWRAFRGSIISAAVTIYIAYVLWQVVFIHTETTTLPSPGQMQLDENGGPPPIASRLQTMLPALRIFMLTTIATVAALIALSDLGVNTTSLIAGASIFGLAISFGSQSLVHDIVSGIFFMADDAFRIGEYIDTGKAKGTVEGMSVRSLRLRHQNGQIHVIPFGQIQQVTNFSRDWTTVKFNLRLQFDTDIEKVRKTVKQIGAEMMQEPELAAELLEPLKLQGVTEIDPQGLVVRLKFTARPVQPTLLQREALKRITLRFREKGIEFANSNVMLQTVTVPASAEETAKPSGPKAADAVTTADIVRLPGS